MNHDNSPLIRSSYLSSIFHTDRFEKLIDQIVKLIKNSKVDFDTIVFRGSSGAMVVPILALKLKKQMLLIRKDDGNHYYLAVEGHVSSKKFIIVDDLIASGNTIRTIMQKIRRLDVEVYPVAEAECVGIFLYHDDTTSSPFTVRIEDNTDCQNPVITYEEVPVWKTRFVVDN